MFHNKLLRKLLMGWREYIAKCEAGASTIIITWRSKDRCLKEYEHLDPFLKEMGYTCMVHKSPKYGIVAETRLNGYGRLVSDTDCQSVTVKLAA